ncbi:choice-of-anchor I family protein [Thalassotalea litorea]|uniref:choice-of-anchor I family protein n=1 Tax=Thalassotalea litorea TaxID=2020715 RepID=UPI003736A3E1
MKNLTKKIISLSLLSLLGACSLEGDDGINGQVGSSGLNGTNGVNGQNGSDGINANNSVSLQVVGRFQAGGQEILGKSAAEIVTFHQSSQSAFAINGDLNQVEVISLAALPTGEVANPTSDTSLNSAPFTFADNVDVMVSGASENILLGDANSIAIFNDTLAIAVAADTATNAGAILFYQLDDSGNGSFIKAVKVGALPDMVTFNQDGSTVLVANEGEPNSDYTIDPEGSVSIISIDNGMIADEAMTVNLTTDMTFSSDLLSSTDFDSDEKRKALLLDAGLKLAGPAGTTLAQSLEPEYIAVSEDNKTAFVSFQENNALGIIDLESYQIEVKPFGFKDWSQFEMDYTNKDEIASFRTLPGVFGMYQPDTIASFNWHGANFIVTANEGDSRDYDGYTEEVRVKDIIDKDELNLELSDELQALYDQTGGSDGLGRLKVTTALGDVDADGVYETLYAYGARSFSIWDQQGTLVFDSGDDFEKISAAILGNNFNSAHTENKGDNRSDDKGGEPEALALGMVGDRNFAFIGLERSGDIFVYDITNPFNVTFNNHLNNRDFSIDFELDDDLDNPCDEAQGMDCTNALFAGDLGPESMYFVDADKSPNGNPLLLVGSEVSGTVTVYQIIE